MRKYALPAILSILLVFAACGGQSDTTPDTSARDQNLAKLAKVWGFAKYTHPAFLTGEICWDEELLNLMPVIYSADEGDVNGILYDWFVSLGDDGFDGHSTVTVELQTNMPWTWGIEVNLTQQLNEIQGLSLMDASLYDDLINFHVLTVEGNLSYLSELTWVSGLEIIDESDTTFRPMADFSWLSESNLGLSLFERLSRFQAIRPLDRTYAPVSFDNLGNSVFLSQQIHENMDFGDMRYRLLGLFRMWNAIEYYFPYRDILDRDWRELLVEHITMMLEGDDRHSYELTLASLSMNLHDAHVNIVNVGFTPADFVYERFGRNYVPIWLTESEGRLVVYESISAVDGEFLPGDIILALNGTDIDEVTTDMLQFLSFPNEEKALAYIAFYQSLMSHSQIADIDVLRGDVMHSLQVETTDDRTFHRMNVTLPGHALLESNIGLINPRHLSYDNEIHDIMRDFADTDGLIIDLRQYPGHHTIGLLAQYILYENQPFFVISAPSPSAPGTFVDLSPQYAGPIDGHHFNEYFYDRPVVILMDEQTLSWGETMVMMLRTGPNVTVLGSNSIGANGNVTILPLPGRILLSFSGLGVFTPEGGQTQRIGLSPDIRVERTIQGIKEGRDELMEAAIEYILTHP